MSIICLVGLVYMGLVVSAVSIALEPGQEESKVASLNVSSIYTNGS